MENIFPHIDSSLFLFLLSLTTKKSELLTKFCSCAFSCKSFELSSVKNKRALLPHFVCNTNTHTMTHTQPCRKMEKNAYLYTDDDDDDDRLCEKCPQCCFINDESDQKNKSIQIWQQTQYIAKCVIFVKIKNESKIYEKPINNKKRWRKWIC